MASGSALGINLLLDALVRIAPGPWQDDLRLVDLPIGKVLHEPHATRRYVYFPVMAVISLLYVLSDGDMTELCVVGSEGIVGMSSLMSNGTTPSYARVQSGGTAFRLSAGRLRNEFAHKAAVAELLLRYTQVLIVQMAQSAVCYRHHTIDEQLCRWILLMLDRHPGDSIETTQEMIAETLGVGRASVNMAAIQLQKDGLVTHGRGSMTVVDRHALEARVCECYAVIKFEYDRLRPAFEAIEVDRPPPGPADPANPASPRRDRHRLAALRRFDILDSPPEDIFDDIAARASRLLAAPVAMISFLDEDRDWFKSCIGYAASESPADTSFCEVMFDQKEDRVVVHDTLDDRRFSEHPQVRGMPFVRFFAAMRLADRGHTLGTLCVYDFEARRLDGAQLRAFESPVLETMDALIARGTCLRRAAANA